MLVSELLGVLDRLAPFSLAEPWDNCGLLVGDASGDARKVLVALEINEPVLEEALASGADVVLTHHPVLFSPITRLVGSDLRGRLLRNTVKADVNIIACHTNLDAAPGGLADIVGDSLGLREMRPLQMADLGWYKFVGFVPPEALSPVSEAVFAAGAGGIGEYEGCAFSAKGEGWFRPGPAARPAVGTVGAAERVPEARWETMVPRERVASVIAAYLDTHPYEEPAFDVYPVENRRPRAGLGRVGVLDGRITVEELAARLVDKLKVPEPAAAGRLDQPVGRVAVLPGSGRSLLAEAAKVADVFITGDLSYHDAETASELGIALVSVGHGDLEWAAMKAWTPRLREVLEPHGVEVETSRAWQPAWRSGGSCEGGVCGPAVARPRSTRRADMPSDERPSKGMTLWVDGGSRGNPGPSAIGVVLREDGGELVEEVGRTIGVATNNVAEYQALLEGLQMASRHGARRIEILSDSELLVKQMRGEYRVKNEGLRGLFAEAKMRLEGFDQTTIRHVPREENALADALVNQALDDAAGASETAKADRDPKGETAPGLF